MMSYDAQYFNISPGIHLDGIKIFLNSVFGSELLVGHLRAKIQKHKLYNFAILIPGVKDRGNKLIHTIITPYIHS